MAFRVKEINGASGTETPIGFDTTQKYQYEAWGTTLLERNSDQYIANLIEAVRAYTPATLSQLPTGSTARPNILRRGAISWNEDEDSGLKRHFLFDVEYKANSLPEEGESLMEWSFDTQGGTVKIFTSQATAKFPAGAPSFNNCIDVNDDAEVQGVEIVLPALKLTARKRWLAENALYKWDTFQSYIRSLTAVTGTTNSAIWQGYAIGELLFLGASGRFQDGKDNEIEYHFAASANVGAYNIGSIALSGKKGHDYVWVRYEHALNASQLVRAPKWAYVERVYGESNFATSLGIS